MTRNDGLRIVEAAKLGSLRGTFSTIVQTEWRRVPIVVAHIPGTHSDDFAFANGHVDSWYYGTTDNATGNAACLELARVALAGAGRTGARRARRVVDGALAGAIRGQCVVRGQCLGGPARARDHQHQYRLARREGRDALRCRDDGRGDGAVRHRRSIQDLTGQHAEAERPTRAGDQSFWGPGVPSLYMLLSNLPKEQWAAVGGCGMNWWWHTEADTVETADRDVLALDTRIYAATLARLCSGPVLPFTLADAAREIDALLADYEKQAAGRFDLSPARARAAEAIRADRGTGCPRAGADRANARAG